MSKEKQIEEMAKEIKAMSHCEGYADDRGCYYANSCTACKEANAKQSTEKAKRLYNAGYRKQSEVTREIFEEINAIKKEYSSGDIDGNELYIRLHMLEKKYTEGEI